jgi:Tfp pilus assembly protein PilO
MTANDLTILIKKQPLGFGCGLVCLLAAGWLYFRGGELEKRQGEYEAKSAEAARLVSNVAASKNLPEQVAEIQVLTKELESRVVKAGQLAVNLQYFYKLEAETEVKLLDVRQNPIPRNTKTLYLGIPYNVNIQGSFKQVMAFVQRLEKGRHFCRINTANFIKLGAAGDGSTGMTLSLTLDLLGQP